MSVRCLVGPKRCFKPWRLGDQGLRDRGQYGTGIAFSPTPCQADELPHALSSLVRLPGVPLWAVADRGYSSNAFREYVWKVGARPTIPPKRNETLVACPVWIYNNRKRVERLWASLKEWRAVATRYGKNAASFLGVLQLAATLDWIRR